MIRGLNNRCVHFLAAVTCLLMAAPPCRAVELQAEFGLRGATSSWKTDGGAGSQVRAAARFSRVFAVDFLVWEDYLTVDQRSNTGLTFGIAGHWPGERFRPSARLFAIHQHEEGLVSVKDHPWGTLFGIGAGIRHRAGGGASVGMQIPFGRGRFGEYYAFGTGTLTWFPDASLGPATYFAAAAGVGLSYALEFK